MKKIGIISRSQSIKNKEFIGCYINYVKKIEPYIINKNSLNYIKKKIDENSIRESNNKNMSGGLQRNNSMIMKGIYSAFNAFSSISNLMSIEQPSISADLIDKLISPLNLPKFLVHIE